MGRVGRSKNRVLLASLQQRSDSLRTSALLSIHPPFPLLGFSHISKQTAEGIDMKLDGNMINLRSPSAELPLSPVLWFSTSFVTFPENKNIHWIVVKLGRCIHTNLISHCLMASDWSSSFYIFTDELPIELSSNLVGAIIMRLPRHD